ncbi:hypothetical protein V8G61_05230 [Gaetbulibacter sp. M240]|uniref:hypothetical protein n=1 Tax=Gaetbulibacter sp. M240 TaxID=3126511 RepID=UPI00374F5961
MRKLFLFLLLLPLIAVSQDDESYLLNITEITVKQGHNAQFMEGVKTWKKCYKDNKGENPWNMWSRVQGEGSVYALTSRMANWAEMDEGADEAAKACRMHVVNLIMPNVKSANFNIASNLPKVSTTMSDDNTVVWVWNVKAKKPRDFMAVVNEISSSLQKAEGNKRGTWYSMQGGGPDAADFFVAVPFKNFAGMDVDRDGVWEIYEKQNGKSKTEALREKMSGAIESEWTYIYSLNKDMSF